MKTEITGVDDVQELLESIAPRHAVNIMRATVHGIAGTIRDDAKDNMQEDTGTMKKATKAKRERTKNGIIWSTVRVAPEAFYWRYEEYGQGPDGLAKDMFMKAVADYRANSDQIFVQEFGKKFEAALARERRKQS